MQHPCYRCGANVDDGIPFCRQCNAPQIKVAASEPPDPAELLKPELEVVVQPTLQRESTPRARSIDWRSALPAVFFVAVPAGLLSSSPLSILFFIWTFAAGALCVASYRKRTETTVSTGLAARLGFLAGGVAFAVFLLIFLVAISRPEFATLLKQQLHSQVEGRMATNPDPSLRQFSAVLDSPEGFATVLTLAVAMMGVLFLFFSVLGAIAGATVFAPKNRAP